MQAHQLRGEVERRDRPGDGGNRGKPAEGDYVVAVDRFDLFVGANEETPIRADWVGSTEEPRNVGLVPGFPVLDARQRLTRVQRIREASAVTRSGRMNEPFER